MTDEAKLYERITRHIDVFDDEYGARARSINDRGEAAIAAICDDFEQRQACQIAVIERLRGALADIAHSDDMTLDIARKKAKRIYDETADPLLHS